MKKLHSLLSVLFLTFWGCDNLEVKSINEDETQSFEIRDDKMFLINSQKPFSGTSYMLFPNGRKMFERTWENGEKNGPVTFWYENGQKRQVINFKNGIVDWIQDEWYENGQKSSEVLRQNDKQVGDRIGWDEDGNRTYKGIWNYGYFTGSWDVWYKNGQKQKEMIYKDGEIISIKEWNEDGSVKEWLNDRQREKY